jgi:ribosome maturation factor RimP
MRQPLNGQRNFRGRIVGVQGDKVIFDDRTSGEVSLPFDDVVKANLELDVEQEFRKAKERELVNRE